MNCCTFFNVEGSDKYELKKFSFEDIDCKDSAKEKAFTKRPVDGLTLKNVKVNGVAIQ